MHFLFIEKIIAAQIAIIPLAGLVFGLICSVSKQRRTILRDHAATLRGWVTVWILLISLEIFAAKPAARAARIAWTKNGTLCIVNGMRAHYTEYGIMPSGGNAEIISALRGNNPRKIIFFDVPPKDINAKGEYLDLWGTPYRIGASNPKTPWAYSFGPNKRDDGGAEGSDDIVNWQ